MAKNEQPQPQEQNDIQKANPPVDEKKCENVKGLLWKNEGQKEGTYFYKVTYNMHYKPEGTDQWQEGTSFSGRELDSLAQIAEEYAKSFGVKGEKVLKGLKPIVSHAREEGRPTTVKVDNVVVKIWTNTSEGGKLYKKATVACLYEDNDGKWAETSSFGMTDNVKLAAAARAAQDHMAVPANDVTDETAGEVSAQVENQDPTEQ